jgi:hypothetical protein
VLEIGRGTEAGSLALVIPVPIPLGVDIGAVLPVDVLGRSGSPGRPGVAG